jgi:hypothetical protein
MMSRTVAVNESMVVITEMKRKNPIMSLRGIDLRKFSCSKGEVRIDRNITTEDKELAMEATSMMVKAKKMGLKRKFG